MRIKRWRHMAAWLSELLQIPPPRVERMKTNPSELAEYIREKQTIYMSDEADDTTFLHEFLHHAIYMYDALVNAVRDDDAANEYEERLVYFLCGLVDKNFEEIVRRKFASKASRRR